MYPLEIVSMTYTQSIVPKETVVWICVASFLRWVSQYLADTQIIRMVESMDGEGNVKPQEKDWRTSETPCDYLSSDA